MSSTPDSDAPCSLHGHTLDPHEMRCLSVVAPMTFLLCAEFDVFLAAKKAHGTPFEVVFPALGAEFVKALRLCAARFSLDLLVDGAGKTKRVVVHGTAKLPLLRYVDFLPGMLHTDEILSVAGVKITATDPTPATGKGITQAGATGASYVASCVDYPRFEKDDPKFEAASFVFTLDLGLPLATMAHLLRFDVAPISSSSDAVKSFQRFSHWTKFDLRWDSDSEKQSGVIVFPSVADVHDLLERYEDEDTSDDATLLFRLRPVAPCAHVPYLEDALVRRLREQHWAELCRLWQADARFATSRVPILQVSKWGQATSLGDLLAQLGGKANVIEATVVAEDTPPKRRVLYVLFRSLEDVRAAMALDGQRMSSMQGKPVIRVSVAPPFMNTSRRGHVLETLTSPTTSAAVPATKKASSAGKGGGAKESENVGVDTKKKKNSAAAGKNDTGGGPSPPAAQSTPSPATKPAAVAKPPPVAVVATSQAEAPKGRGASPKQSAVPAAPPIQQPQPQKQENMDREVSEGSSSPMKREHTSPPVMSSSHGSGTRLNKSAAPFTPSPKATFAAPPPPPPSYQATAIGGPTMVGASSRVNNGGAPPPPYQQQVPPTPPPAYQPSPIAGSAPPPPYQPSPGGASAPPPPQYQPSPLSAPAPPPYQTNPPPPYTLSSPPTRPAYTGPPPQYGASAPPPYNATAPPPYAKPATATKDE